ncbi:hypothetical protein ACHAXS_011513 [Conticribra weissflogii]
MARLNTANASSKPKTQKHGNRSKSAATASTQVAVTTNGFANTVEIDDGTGQTTIQLPSWMGVRQFHVLDDDGDDDAGGDVIPSENDSTNNFANQNNIQASLPTLEIERYQRHLALAAISLVGEWIDDCVGWVSRHCRRGRRHVAHRASVARTEVPPRRRLDVDFLGDEIRRFFGMFRHAASSSSSASALTPTARSQKKYNPLLLPMVIVKCHPNILDRTEMVRVLTADLETFKQHKHLHHQQTYRHQQVEESKAVNKQKRKKVDDGDDEDENEDDGTVPRKKGKHDIQKTTQMQNTNDDAEHNAVDSELREMTTKEQVGTRETGNEEERAGNDGNGSWSQTPIPTPIPMPSSSPCVCVIRHSAELVGKSLLVAEVLFQLVG